MSVRPSAPSQPDVFFSPSLSLFPTHASSPSGDRDACSLVPVAHGWVNAAASSLDDALPLESIDEGNTDDEDLPAYETEAREAHSNLASCPATPPVSPHPGQLGDTSGTPPLARQLKQYTPSKLSGSVGPKLNSPDSPVSPTFNPVVGSSSTTPTRPERPFKSIYQRDLQVKSASNPATPLRLSAVQPTSSFTPDRAGPAPDLSSWTWPPRNFNSDEPLELRYRSPVATAQYSSPRERDDSTPTRATRHTSSLVDSPLRTAHSTAPAKVATRYVLVEGLRADLTEADLRELLLPRCAGLSVRGCFTARLRDFGEVVLLFHDVRHALAASRLVEIDETGEMALRASCITRVAFEQLLSTLQAQALLSRSEAVLVFTFRGPSATPYFSPLSLLAQYGEIRTLKVVEEHLHVVEYWDDRSAEQASKALKGQELHGTRLDCSFEPVVAGTELPAWTSKSAIPTASSAAPVTPFFPPTPVATPVERERSATNYRFPASSSPDPARAFFFPSPHTSASHQVSPLAPLAGANETWTDPRDRVPHAPQTTFAAQQREQQTPPFTPVAPAGLLHFAPPASAPSRSPPFTAPAEASRAAAPSWSTKRRSHISKDYGIVRDDRIPASNVLNFERIEQGLDVRTTVMIKNIPNKLKDYEVMEFIEEVVGRAFDFFYLRCDYSNNCNVGYGFCNFTSTDALLAFAKARLGTRWNLCGSDKLCVLSYANIQGKASLISHFRNSSVLDQEENRRPKLFVSSGPRAGEPEPFPACDDPIRKARSAMNASSVGLFPSQRPVFKVAQAFKGLSL